MQAYLNNPVLKIKTIAMMQHHIKADDLLQGQYWQEDPDGKFRGCAVGCLSKTTEDGDPNGGHSNLSVMFGFPYSFAHTIDDVFEEFEDRQGAQDFTIELLEAIPVGADLQSVTAKFDEYDATLGGCVEDYADKLKDHLIKLVKACEPTKV